jgi:elongation factor G
MATDEANLAAQVATLRGKYAIAMAVAAPQVRYHETLERPTEAEYTHKKQLGGSGQFARVKLRLKPNESGKGNAFASEVVGNVVPKGYIPGVEKGVRSVWESGVVLGAPMVDTQVTLVDGAYHELDSSESVFEAAASQAMREGCKRAGVKLLEPIMDVELVTPCDLADRVERDINGRRGQVISNQELRGGDVVMRGHVPLASLIGYSKALRWLTGGRATLAARFSHYGEAPPDDTPGDFSPAAGMRT